MEEADSGAVLMEKIEESQYDVIILDMTLPDMNGLDVLKTLRERGKRARVLVLSMHPAEQYATRALKAGAAGYLQKESAPAELVNAVRTIVRGGKYVTAFIAEKLALELQGSPHRPSHELLSNREYQVFCLLVSGKGIKEIAHELGLTPPTVGTYKARVLTKLNLSSTVELVRYALSHKLAE